MSYNLKGQFVLSNKISVPVNKIVCTHFVISHTVGILNSVTSLD